MSTSNSDLGAALRIAITAGEPAGIGPDLVIQLAQQPQSAQLPPVERIVIADPDLLAGRAALLGLPLTLKPFDPNQPPQPSAAGELTVLPARLEAACTPSEPSPANASYVLASLQTAVDGCLQQQFDAMVTGPVHKAVINDAGIPFSGHTEFLAAATHTEQVVMMLASDRLRVALVTTHLPLSEVPAAITAPLLERVIGILQHDLQRHFGIPRPRILVLGLNPHAGEGGHLGREEIDTLIPCLQKLRAGGLDLAGPLPADTAFTPKYLQDCDAVLAMYHDQGLPVLKYQGFGRAVNITLGLPIIRTSVDHGTALELAGTGRADVGSLATAVDYATRMAHSREPLRNA